MHKQRDDMSNKTSTIAIRCSDAELERFKRAARVRNPHDEPNLSAFMRSVAHEYADTVGVDLTPGTTKESK